MSDHSDLVARARAHAAEREAEGKGAAMLWELADALDVKPGANADLIARLKQVADDPFTTAHSSLLLAAARALEAADSRARVLPTREEMTALIDRNRHRDSEDIADAVRALLTGGKVITQSEIQAEIDRRYSGVYGHGLQRCADFRAGARWALSGGKADG